MSDYPSEALRTQVYDGYMSKPMDLPGEFKSWLTDYLAVNVPFIPVSQLLGYKGTLAQSDIAGDTADMVMSGGDRTWQDASDGDGPVISQLADGTYFVCFGVKTGRANVGSSETRYGPSVNGATPTTFATFMATDPDAMVWRAAVLSVAGNDNSEIRMKYWFDNNGGASAQFQHRWLTCVRIT